MAFDIYKTEVNGFSLEFTTLAAVKNWIYALVEQGYAKKGDSVKIFPGKTTGVYSGYIIGNMVIKVIGE